MVCFWTQKCWLYRHNLTGRTKHPKNSPWELLTLYQASTSPKSGWEYPTGASPKIFKTIISQHAWDRTIETGQSCQGKLIHIWASSGSASVSNLVRKMSWWKKTATCKVWIISPWSGHQKYVWCCYSDIAHFSLVTKKAKWRNQIKLRNLHFWCLSDVEVPLAVCSGELFQRFNSEPEHLMPEVPDVDRDTSNIALDI